MKQSLQIFSSDQFGQMRTVLLDGEPFFLASDITSALGYSQSSKAIKDNVDSEDCKVLNINNLHQQCKLLSISDLQILWQGNDKTNKLVINESGLYSLIMGSRLPKAKEFKRWVTSEVLPAIRKTGGYMTAREDETPEEIMARALMVAKDTLARRDREIELKNQQIAAQKEEIRELDAKASYATEVLQSTDCFTFTQVAHDLGLRSANVFIKGLLDKRIIYKQSGQYQPASKFADMGIFATRTYSFVRSSGEVGTRLGTVVTEKGRAWLHSNFKKIFS